MGRELRSLGKVEEGDIIRAQCHTEFEPQVFRHHGHLACTNKHTHAHTWKNTRLLQSILSKKKSTLNCYYVWRNLMSLQFTCYIRFSSEKIQTASTITKRFNSRKKSLDGFSPVGQLTCKLFIEFTSCGGRWKKKAQLIFNQRKCFTNSRRLWLYRSYNFEPLNLRWLQVDNSNARSLSHNCLGQRD